MTTGERIRQARKAAGLTQKELAAKCGVKYSAIHKYETNMVVNLKRETVQALADALNVTPSWLLCLDDETNRQQDELADLLEDLKNREDMQMLFKLAHDATPDDVRQAVKIIEALRKEE